MSEKEVEPEFKGRQWFRTPRGRVVLGNAYHKAHYRELGFVPCPPPKEAKEKKARGADSEKVPGGDGQDAGGQETK